ncbi:DNA/RNA non-specific endonuclease [Arthrobacter sp. H5]|uniref:DNA/RNA non-specific endonuclease n=1 Tax=Arthrobacter sp. H5 TaxID=1267973 RepID=UPI000685949B|nr:DNA/RNA non-specific endonuclease [Arthrobacter sp. H5]
MNALLPEPTSLKAGELSGRTGFDEQFLGPSVPIPALDGGGAVLLPYTNFSVLMRPDKRLTAITALGIDGAKLMDLDRSGIDWRLDPRLAEDQQTGERLYARNDIDRGHLVRRASAVWGDTAAEAAQANEDTFFYTNAAPQAADFNQSLELWLGLESYLLENAADNGRPIGLYY